ncbi:MAG: hypothetical protein KDA78_16865 [Planctomycetaceae bacterium]|nr:hypothetical protein [Planctomycetaceae bacterium]
MKRTLLIIGFVLFLGVVYMVTAPLVDMLATCNSLANFVVVAWFPAIDAWYYSAETEAMYDKLWWFWFHLINGDPELGS